MTIESNRLLGGVGALLTVIGVIGQLTSIAQIFYPNSLALNLVGFTGIFPLIGLIFFLIAMYGFSKDYSNSGIFDNALYGLIAGIVVGVLAGLIVFVIILFNFNSIFPNLNFNPTTPPQITTSGILAFLAPILPAVSLAAIVQAVFYRRAFNLLSRESGVPLFKTGGKVLLIGALVSFLLSIIAAVLALYTSISISAILAIPIAAAFIQYFAWGLLAMAYLRIKPQPSQPSTTAQAMHSTAIQVKYCTYCGAENKIDAVYCVVCGRKQ